MPGVLLVPALNASEWTGPTGNNTYLLPGSMPALIDAGTGHPDHLAAVERALAGRALGVVLVTHGHPDHAGGLPALRRRWQGLLVRNVPPLQCRDGELVRAGDTELRAVHTPGHAPDHFCFLDEPAGDVYCGDLARSGGSLVIPASQGGNLGQYLDSLRRVLALRPRRLLPGHGPIVTDPAALIDRYLRHRAERETQILDALQAGCGTIDRLVERVYGTLSPVLLRGAADTVLAHLGKLEEEGRITGSNGEWRVR